MSGTLGAGRYRLGAVLASRPATEVRRAIDTTVGREVAVKLVRPPAGAEPAEALAREARLRARVDSPHLPSLYEHGRQQDDAGSVPFLVGQLVTGGSLATLLAARGRPPSRVTAAIGAGLAAAIGDLHRAGVAHGRIDASHVLLRDPSADSPHVYLVGLGAPTATASDDLVALGALVRDCLGEAAAEEGRGSDLATLADAAVASGLDGGTDVEPFRRRLADLAVSPSPSASAPRPPARRRRGVLVAGLVAGLSLVLLAALAAGGGWLRSPEDSLDDGERAGSREPLSGDIDGDGLGEVVLYRPDGINVTTAVLSSDGSSFSAPEVTRSPGALVLTGDVDGDDRTDLVRAFTGSGGGLEVQLGTGERRVAASPPLGEDLVPKLVDLDGDGRDDLAATSGVGQLPLTLQVGLTADDGAPGALRDVALPNLDAGFLAPADVDGDASAEVVHLAPDRLTEGAVAVTVLDGDPEQGYAPAGPPTLLDVDLEITAAGDVDGDGAEEIVVRRTVGDRSGLAVLDLVLDDGRPTLEEQDWWDGGFAASQEVPFRPLVLDVDGDGDGDLVQPELADDGVLLRVLRSTGERFEAPTTWGRWDCAGPCKGVLAAGPNR